MRSAEVSGFVQPRAEGRLLGSLWLSLKGEWRSSADLFPVTRDRTQEDSIKL